MNNAKEKKPSKTFPECEHCIYRPCYKVGDERRYCLIRYLIWESDEQNRERRKEKRDGKTDDPQ